MAWVLNVKSLSGEYHYSATLFHTRSNPGRSMTSGLHRLHSQYHVCWCSSDFRSQGISSHVTDPQSQNIPSPASKELRSLHHLPGTNELKPCGLMDSDGLSLSRCHPSSRGIPIINIKSTACARLQQLQWASNGVTAVLHYAITMVRWLIVRTTFCCFWLFHILMPYNIILYFCLPYFHLSNSALFST